MIDRDAPRRGQHGHGRTQYWDARHALYSLLAGLLLFVVVTIANSWVGDVPLVARGVVAALTALVVYFRFD